MGMNCFVPFQAGEPLDTGVDYFVETLPFIGVVVFMVTIGLGLVQFLRTKDFL